MHVHTWATTAGPCFVRVVQSRAVSGVPEPGAETTPTPKYLYLPQGPEPPGQSALISHPQTNTAIQASSLRPLQRPARPPCLGQKTLCSRAMAGFKLPLDVSGRSRGGGRGTPRKLPSHGHVAWHGWHRAPGESCCRKQPCQQSLHSQLNTPITLLRAGICAAGAHGVRLHGAWGHGLQHAQERP